MFLFLWFSQGLNRVGGWSDQTRKIGQWHRGDDFRNVVAVEATDAATDECDGVVGSKPCGTASATSSWAGRLNSSGFQSSRGLDQ